MAHDHIIYDSDPHFSIDVDTRAISYVSPEKLVVVQGDHNSEIFTFDMPRYADGHDMLECDIRQIHYINLDGERGILKSIGVYPIADMKESEEDSNKVVFSWTIAQNATKYVGTLSFAIRFACSGENSTLDYVWRTLPYSSVPVSKSIDNVEEFVEDYTDVLQEWYDTLMASGQEGVNMVEDAKQQAITNIEDTRKQAVSSVEQALASVGGIIVSITAPTTEKAVAWLNPETSVLRIKDDNGDWKSLDSIKGDPGSLENVAQEFGYDEELVISQKVITEKIQELENKDGEFQSRFDSDASSWTDVGNRLNSLEQADSEFDNRFSNLENTVTGEHTMRLESLESKDAEIEDTLSSHQTHISALSDAMVDRTTRIRALEAKDTELEGSISELNAKDTELEGFISELQVKDAELESQIAKQIMCKSGTYAGNGDTSSGPPIYFGSTFVPEFVIIKDSNCIMPDLIITRDYTDPLYESNTMRVYPIGNNTNVSLVKCMFAESSGIQRLTIGNASGNATSADRIYNASGVTYYWFAIGTKPQS